MADERITERTDGTVSERTIERTEGDRVVVERRGGGGGTAILVILLLAALAIGGYFLLRADNRDATESAAVTDAAKSVGDTAEKAGDAVTNAVQ